RVKTRRLVSRWLAGGQSCSARSPHARYLFSGTSSSSLVHRRAPVPARGRPTAVLFRRHSMITKTFIPKQGTRSFAIMKLLALAPHVDVTSVSAGRPAPYPGRLHGRSRYRVHF